MATKIMWLHLSIGIPLSLLIAFTYQLILIGLLFAMTTRILLSLRIGVPISHWWEAQQPSSWGSVLLFYLLLHLLLHLMSVYYRNIVWVKSETPSNAAWAYLASEWMMRYSVSEDLGIVGTDLKPWGLDLKTRLEDIPDGYARYLGLMARKTNSGQHPICIW